MRKINKLKDIYTKKQKFCLQISKYTLRLNYRFKTNDNL